MPNVVRHGPEGVITSLPDLGKVARYTEQANVPLLERFRAKQIGAAGYWYVPVGQTVTEAWDNLTNAFWSTAAAAVDERDALVDDAKQATQGHGVLGVFSTLLGIPYPLSVVLVLFVAYALLRGAGLVPSLRGVVK